MKAKRKGWILFAVFAVLLALIIFCVYRYYQSEIVPVQQLDDAYEAQQEIIAQIKPPVRTGEKTDHTENPLTSCEDVNDDTVGWIYIPDTNIDLPIVQGEDNDFYLHNGVNGQYNFELGCPFLDYRCESDFQGFNAIVYGHHMTQRRMFADISLFADAGFMQNHPTGCLTLPDGVHTVTFFAYLNTYSTAPVYYAVFVTDSEKREYLEYIFTEAKHTQALSAADISENAHLLLLSTCTYEFNDARGILVGVIEER